MPWPGAVVLRPRSRSATARRPQPRPRPSRPARPPDRDSRVAAASRPAGAANTAPALARTPTGISSTCGGRQTRQHNQSALHKRGTPCGPRRTRQQPHMSRHRVSTRPNGHPIQTCSELSAIAELPTGFEAAMTVLDKNRDIPVGAGAARRRAAGRTGATTSTRTSISDGMYVHMHIRQPVLFVARSVGRTRRSVAAATTYLAPTTAPIPPTSVICPLVRSTVTL